MTRNYEQSIRELLGQLSKDELIDFIATYSVRDDRFADAVSVRFSEPEFQHEITKLEKRVDAALEPANEYRTYGGWGYIDIDLSDIVMEIEQRTKQGHIKLAFDEVELLYRKLLENFEYQQECELSDEAESCLDLMAEIAGDAVLSEDKEYIFEQCIKLSELEDGKDYGADYEGELLRIAARFVTPDNLEKLEEAMECINSSWREEEYKLIQVEIIRRLEGDDSAEIYIRENVHLPKIREIAYDTAMLRKDFSIGEQLCIDALTLYTNHYSVSMWLHRLYSVYEISGNAEKLAETAQEILLRGDMRYYAVLKSQLTEQGMWSEWYPELLCKCEKRLSYVSYMEILAEEQEIALLLEQVRVHTEQIYLYGKLLAEKYTDEVYELFTMQINNDAEAAYGRDAYRTVCSRILSFMEAGYGGKAIEMVNEFKLKYKRKPAFVDELKKINN